MSLIKYINKKFLLFFVIAILSIFFLHTNFLSNGNLGTDFSYFIPLINFNKYWIIKNGISIPLFNPSYCGGFVGFANPQDMFFSIKQLIFLLFKNEYSLKLIFLLYSSLGYLGTYLLCNKIFKCSFNISTLASYIFLFNSFCISRYLTGHFAFIEFYLLPLYSFLILSILETSRKEFKYFYFFSAVLLLASIIYSGSSSIIVYFLISFGIIVLIKLNYKFDIKQAFKTIALIVVNLGFFISISSYKFFLFYKLLINLPRSLDPILFLNIYEYFKILFLSFFFDIGFLDINNYVDGPFRINDSETHYGISIVSLILLITIIFNKKFYSKYYISLIVVVVLFFVVCLICLNNFYYHKLLISNLTSIPFRFNSVFILPIILIISLNLNTINKIKISNNYYFLVLLLFIIVGQQGLINRSHYQENSYKFNTDFDKLENLPGIERVAIFTDKKNKLMRPIDRNELFLIKISTINCYEPLHGYFNEKMNISNFHFSNDKKTEGEFYNIYLLDPLKLNNNYYGMFNPSCFLFPEENNCVPYDQFNVSQKEEVVKFINYNKFNFSKPKKLLYFKIISFITLLISVSFIIWFFLINFLRKIYYK